MNKSMTTQRPWLPVEVNSRQLSDQSCQISQLVDAFAGAVSGQQTQAILDEITGPLLSEVGGSAHCFIIVKDTHSATGWTSNSDAQQPVFAQMLSMSLLDNTPLATVLANGLPVIAEHISPNADSSDHALLANAMGLRFVTCAPIQIEASGEIAGAVLVYQRVVQTQGRDVGDIAMGTARVTAALMQVRSIVQKADRATTDLATLASTIPGVVYQRRVELNGKIKYTYISESAFDLFGVTAETILSDPEALFQHYGKEYRETFRKRLIQASKNMDIWDVEATILRPDGQKRYTHAIARPTREPDGSVLWTGVILDATRIKEAELAATAAEARTREVIVESLSQGLILFDSEDRLSVKNSHFDRLHPGLEKLVVPGAMYEDVIRAELEPTGALPSRVSNGIDELAYRLLHHGDKHIVYERQMKDDKFILVNEYRTPEKETVVVYTDITDLRLRERKINHLAHHDSLTGLANRVLFREKLDNSIATSGSGRGSTAVLCLDLDRFKFVNDTMGHHVGDLLLKQVAARILSRLRPGDIASRLGGDEFAIIMGCIQDQQGSGSLARRVIDTLSNPFSVDGHTVVIGASIGIALSDGTVSADDILKNADLALYRAKAESRGTFRYFEAEMDEKAKARRMLEFELRKAIAADELDVFYQPQVDTDTAQLKGVEALIRWTHPKLGPISPSEFIPLAEDSGLIAPIGLNVLRRACRDASCWKSDIRIAVNVSPAQFRSSTFVDDVKSILVETGLNPNRLELEITESLLMRNTDTNLNILHELKAIGIRISMDDFGTGYSSLGSLRSFPFDKIKIDQSFINDLDKTADAAAIIRAILSLGCSLGITTTAEGVETIQQLDYLRAEGCDEVQGFYYAKAMSAASIDAMLKTDDVCIMLPSNMTPYAST